MWRPSKRHSRRCDYGIIFDFDGTLAHLSIDFGAMRQAVNHLFLRYGISPDRLYRRYILERIDEAVERQRRIDPERAHRLHEEAFALLEGMERAAAEKSHLLPGVYRRLWKLHQAGAQLAIATRNCRQALEKVLGTARTFFDIILTRENSPAYKPEKAALRPILDRFRLPPTHLCMIGDHPIDILTAQRLSITPIGVLTGTGTRKALEEAGSGFLFKHVNQALDFLFPHLLYDGKDSLFSDPLTEEKFFTIYARYERE